MDNRLSAACFNLCMKYLIPKEVDAALNCLFMDAFFLSDIARIPNDGEGTLPMLLFILALDESDE